MNTDSNFYQSITGSALATALMLLIPLIAMLITDEMAWTLSDFIYAGILIFGTGLAYNLITRILAPRMGDNIAYRVAVGFALFTGLFLIWTNLAVGIVGSEDNPVNVMYFGVIFVGIIGAFIARFQPRGLALTLFTMAFAQALISMIALFTGVHHSPGITVYHILGVNGFFITLFVVAGMLFRYAEEEQLPANDHSEG